MKAYKGFNKDLTCRDYQFKDGETHEHDGPVKLCESGFHAVLSPLDVFSYYPPGSSAAYRVVELDEVSSERRDDSKVVAKRLSIGASIDLAGLAQAHVEYVRDNLIESGESAATNTGDRTTATNTRDLSAATNTGRSSTATNTGVRSTATNTGGRSTATNTGGRSTAANTGKLSAAMNTGYWSTATNTGDRSTATNTGVRSTAANTGHCSTATNTGDWSTATNTGYSSTTMNTGRSSTATNAGDLSTATVEGPNSVAIVTGYKSKASGEKGCWLVLTEKNDDYTIKEVRAVEVDGENIKAKTFYSLINGIVTEMD